MNNAVFLTQKGGKPDSGGCDEVTALAQDRHSNFNHNGLRQKATIG
jgi:hypothetical protein